MTRTKFLPGDLVKRSWYAGGQKPDLAHVLGLVLAEYVRPLNSAYPAGPDEVFVAVLWSEDVTLEEHRRYDLLLVGAKR